MTAGTGILWHRLNRGRKAHAVCRKELTATSPLSIPRLRQYTCGEVPFLSPRDVKKVRSPPNPLGTPPANSVFNQARTGTDRPGTGDAIFGLGLGLKVGVHQAPRIARWSPAAGGGPAPVTNGAALAAAGGQAAPGLGGGHLCFVVRWGTAGKTRATQTQVPSLQRGAIHTDSICISLLWGVDSVQAEGERMMPHGYSRRYDVFA